MNKLEIVKNLNATPKILQNVTSLQDQIETLQSEIEISREPERGTEKLFYRFRI